MPRLRNCTPRRKTTYEAEPPLNRLARLCVQVNDRLRGGDIFATRVPDPWLDLSGLLGGMFAMATTKIESRTVEAVLKSHHGCGYWQREIASFCGLSAGVVSKLKRLVELSWSLRPDLRCAKWQERLYQRPARPPIQERPTALHGSTAAFQGDGIGFGRRTPDLFGSPSISISVFPWQPAPNLMATRSQRVGQSSRGSALCCIRKTAAVSMLANDLFSPCFIRVFDAVSMVRLPRPQPL